MLLRHSHHRTRSRLYTATVAGKTAAIVVPCRRRQKKGDREWGVLSRWGGGHGPWAQPPVGDPLTAAVAFVRSQACPAVELPPPVTDPAAPPLVAAIVPAPVPPLTAHAPPTSTPTIA